MTRDQTFEDYIEENEEARFFYGGYGPGGKLIRTECADSLKELLAVLCIDGVVKASVIEDYGFMSSDDIYDLRMGTDELLGLITYQTRDCRVVLIDKENEHLQYS